jgi:hypothetical protein
MMLSELCRKDTGTLPEYIVFKLVPITYSACTALKSMLSYILRPEAGGITQQL